MREEMDQNASPDQLLDAVVVGGGQAGPAIAWHLKRQGLRFVVLEAGSELGHSWRDGWDSLKLFTPAQIRRPARHAVPGSGRQLPDERIRWPTISRPSDRLRPPSSAQRPGDQPYPGRRRGSKSVPPTTPSTHDRVVVATGPFQVPFVPPAAQGLEPSVSQVHSASYRKSRGPARRTGAGRRGPQLRVRDRRGIGCHPPSRPLHR